MKQAILLGLIFITGTSVSPAQSTLIFEFTGIGHPFDKKNIASFENKADANGNLIIEPGIYLTYESYIKKNYVSLQIVQGLYSDAAGQLAGFTQFGYRNRFFHKWRNAFSISFGPTLLYRDDWNNISEYVPQKGWFQNGDWQTRWTLAGELEYNYFLSKRGDLAVSLTFNYEYLGLGFWVGYRYWIQTKVKHNGKCNCHTGAYKKTFKDWFKL
jgi:hypothetical protein